MRLVLVWAHTLLINKDNMVGHSRSRKIKTVPLRGAEADVFYMNLEEVREALQDKYEFLQERHERSKVVRRKLAT